MTGLHPYLALVPATGADLCAVVFTSVRGGLLRRGHSGRRTAIMTADLGLLEHYDGRVLSAMYSRHQEVLILRVDGTDLVRRTRTLATAVCLRPVQARWRNALQGVVADDAVPLRARVAVCGMGGGGGWWGGGNHLCTSVGSAD